MKSLKNNFIPLLLAICAGCHSNSKNEEDLQPVVKTPVSVTSITITSISENIYLNATSLYQNKNILKANINGFVEKVFISSGDYVSAGKPLFTIITKEASALNKFAATDSLLSFKGRITIVAPSTGIVSEIVKQRNDYVIDGDELAAIAEQNSFVFILNIPFEQNKYAAIGTSCNIILPDSTQIKGTITSKLSAIDVVSQTQRYVVKAQTTAILPENLTAIVQLRKNTAQKAQVLEKSCILTDETMENYWVMKLLNDTTAVKVIITKGISTGDKIEIVSPQFNTNDRIINSGNYGLPDTAFVNIVSQQ